MGLPSFCTIMVARWPIRLGQRRRQCRLIWPSCFRSKWWRGSNRTSRLLGLSLCLVCCRPCFRLESLIWPSFPSWFLGSISSSFWIVPWLRLDKGTLVFGQGGVELIQSGWDFESLDQDSLLSLQENVFRPSDESGQVSLRL